MSNETTDATALARTLVVGSLVVALATTSWQSRGHRAGLVCALLLVPIGFGLCTGIARDKPSFAPYATAARLAVLPSLALYLLFFDGTWKAIAEFRSVLRRPISIEWAALATVAAFVAAALIFSADARRRMSRPARLFLASTARSVANWLHRFAAAADRPVDEERLVELLASTERGSQVHPSIPHRDRAA